jgi:hypothetical protein
MNRTIDRLGIARILLVQVMVLLALAGAVVRYLNWSSDVAWKEFISANPPALAGTSYHLQSQTPVQTVKGKAACARKKS